MFTKRAFRLLITALTFAFGLVAVQTIGQTAASADVTTQAETVYYTAYDYSGEADQAAQIWSSAAPNVNLVPSSSGSITIEATNGGGSRAYVCGLGCATIYIDYQDVAAGNDPLRIVAHEMGHGLGLPDNYNGICDYLMSGGSAGTGCTNPYPNAEEAGEVDYLFGGGFAPSRIGPFVSDVYAPALVNA